MRSLAETLASASILTLVGATQPAIALAQDDAALTSRGIVQSAARIELRADLTAMVTKADFIDGTRFKKGDTLVAFDCRRHQAELNSARAAARGAAVERRNKSSLYSNGAAGKSELLIAKAASNKAEFDVKALKARMQNCTISAPFDGRMVSLNVRPMEMPPADKPLMVIIDDSRLELELVVPSVWLAWLRKDQNFRFNVEETGVTHQATVQRIGAEVDPVSQTVKIYATLQGDLSNTLSGMTGVAVFTRSGS
ncbi:MAG: HlyD family efflux transporter periplasmic adaptor subunit [Pseudomonadota bacterium]